MKKFLIYSCIVLTFFGILISAAPFLLRVTGLDGPAKRFLLENILTDRGNQFDIQKIDIGLGKFEISEVSFKSSNQRLEIIIDKIILEFNIIDYLRSPTNLKNSLQEIYFSNPQLIIHQKPSVGKDIIVKENQNLKSLVTELNAYKNLGIEKGQIIYEDSIGIQHIYAQDLKGWLNHIDAKTISLNLIGNSFTSKTENFKIEAQIDNESQNFLSNVAILNYNFNDPSLEFLFENIELEGHANGSLIVGGNFGKIGRAHV